MTGASDELDISLAAWPAMGMLFGGQQALASLIEASESFAASRGEAAPDPDDPTYLELVELASQVEALMAQGGAAAPWGRIEERHPDYGELPQEVAQRALRLVPLFADDPELVAQMIGAVRDAMDIAWYAAQLDPAARRDAAVHAVIDKGARTLRAMDFSLARIETASSGAAAAQ